MTLNTLEMFKGLFGSAGETFQTNYQLEVGVPMSSNYSAHLSGNSVLCTSTDKCKFAIAEIKSGTLPDDTPLVKFFKGDKQYACIFLREKYSDSFIYLKRVSDYYCVRIEKPEFYELPFFSADLKFSPTDENGNRFKFLDDALGYCYRKITSASLIDLWEKELPYKDAPFCVQSFYLQNKNLPEFAEPYLDAKKLPIKNEKSALWWKCNTAPYKCPNAYCNKEKCLGRKYGVDSKEISELEFGQLTQYAEEPVVYKWLVNGSEMRFDNEVDIINQDKFLRLCMRNLGILPRKLKTQTWLRIINKALANMKVIGEADTAKLTIDSLNEIIVKTLKDRILVSTFFERERLMQGYIYLDPATSCVVVHNAAFCSYITGRFKELRIDSPTEFYSVMRHLGFKSKQKDIDGTKTGILYCRSRFLFKAEQDWKDFLLDISKGTMWEENFKAFLLGDNSVQEDISDIEKKEILDDVAVFLDTERSL